MQGRKENSPIMKNTFLKRSFGDLVYYTIPSFEKSGMVKHGFSSRLGGVSTGEYFSLNLGLSGMTVLKR